MKVKDIGGIVEKPRMAIISSPHNAEIFTPVQKAFADFGKALSQIMPVIGTVAIQIAADHQLQTAIQNMRTSIEDILRDETFLVEGFQAGVNDSIKARWAYQRYIWGTPVRWFKSMIGILRR